MPEETLQERTEEPTPRRREEARKRGQVAKSREAAAVAVLGAALLTFLLAGSFMLVQLFAALRYFLGMPFPSLGFPEVQLYLREALKFGFLTLAPLCLVLLATSILVNVLQTKGILVAWEVISPKAERIHPVEGLKRMFSLSSLVELAKAVIKIAIISLVAYLVVKKHAEKVLSLLGEDLWLVGATVYELSKDLVFKLLIALAVMALLDFLFQRWELERKLRMTREELKEELKQTEGDPLVRARIRQLQREMARRRMMAEVPKADVVITNPEHYAVALKYEMGRMPAPQVVAKGAGALALKIREIAEEHGVPVVEDPPLARLLYSKVEVGDFIPEDLYKAVAEVLAYVWKLKGRRFN